MSTDNKGRAIILVAPSGAGKSTLMKKLKAEFPDFVESISCTTRDMRPNEVDGQHYFFLTREDFQERIKQDDFLEWAKVHTNFYGTSKKFVQKMIGEGLTVLFDIDTQGADAIKSFLKEASIAIFIAPPSFEDLEKRLRGRETETEEQINTRLTTAKSEMLRKDDYDYCIVNDSLEAAYQELKDIVAMKKG